MAIFEDSIFQVSGARQSQPQQVRPDFVASGDWWSLRREDGGYVLDYISGEMAGREKKVRLALDEADSIISGQVKVEDFLIARGAS